ncbi:replication-relaxation family protein [Streptomyces sp. NBC_01775]|uniref:replication-relaxation family protein n=1 Tax=Streptomyces sp. NBC_01775 TaxID=2975939 RepID=UPI002DDB3477|nr:replication-relaxation family protein [Streptomyces sp. NBC_01775]WSB75817.1 replication-relaxation family protein [Streptomyces sp. NBC_01775]
MPPALPRPGSGPGSQYVTRAATTRTRAPARVPLAALASHLTPRDQWLVRMVHEHRVLTTGQIHRLAFSARRRAQRRLLVLHRLGLLDSFRPLTAYGSSPEHYTLGPAGAALLAAHADCAPKALSWRPTHTARIAFSPFLGHDLATNDFLVRLAAHRYTHQAGLTLWLSARSCERRWGDLVHPDAYAHWSDGDQTLPFFLEYDTGSQNLARVEAKLDAYAHFTTTTRDRPALLLHTRTASREHAIRQRLTGTARQYELFLATASADLTTDTPWGPWWLPAHPPALRLTLTELATHWPDLSPAPDLEPIETGTPLALPVPPLPPATTDSRT